MEEEEEEKKEKEKNQETLEDTGTLSLQPTEDLSTKGIVRIK